jgi:MFS family permease
MLADRVGRAKSLIYSILTYSVFTAPTATSTSLWQLVLWRALVGVGLGGEWSAGSVLVAETWPAEHRGKAIGLMQSGWAIGYIIAAVLAAVVMPSYSWRPLFIIGVLPAVVTLWIRRSVPEPAIWKKHVRAKWPPGATGRLMLATLVTSSVLFAYWGLFTWMPSYLSSPVEKGGVGLSVLQSSAWIVPMQIGAFLGYTLFGFLADRFGRRPTFLVFVLAAAVLAPLYGSFGRHEGLLLAVGPLLGFFGHGYFSVFGAMLAELFPSSIRGTAQGLAYNMGRAVSALAPFVIGALADKHGIGAALAVTSVFFAIGGALMYLLPETRGEELA